MKKIMKVAAVGSLLAASALYGVNMTACTGCHGKQFEKHAMGKSKIVKDMSQDEIIAALKGYKNGTYGGAMKAMMKGQVANLSDEDIKAIATDIKAGVDDNPSTDKAIKQEVKKDKAALIDINADASDPKVIAAEDLGKKKVVSEEELGLRKTNLYEENDAAPVDAKFDRPAPGSAQKFQRAYVNAPPMIPHSVEGLLPITQNNNQCLSCHMPDVAKSMGATPIPPSHFTNFRPKTVLKNGELLKEGKVVGPKGDIGNVGDIKLAKAKKLNHLYQGRFNCTQCHAPQANVKPLVGNTFTPDVPDKKLLGSSNLMDTINEGVQ